ncbi:hypothetical protein P8452_03217 [Trifolium repens]|nr:hypothetical protein P8452_03217 [Trifolium repens]
MSAHANSTQDLRINLRFCRVKRVYSLVDENKAIAMEARQESESKKKVYEMDEEVERHRSISGSLKVELQALKERILLVECLPQNSDLESTSVHTGEKISRKLPSEVLELNEALTQIKLLEKENAEKDREIKKCK